MKSYLNYFLILFIFTYSCSPVKNNMKAEWRSKLNYQDNSHASLSQIVVLNEANKVSVVNPLGIQTFEIGNGNSLHTHSSSRKISKNSTPRSSNLLKIGNSSNSNPSSNSSEFQFQKIVYIQVPESNTVLEFNYGSSKEEISLIDLNSGKVIWKNSDLFWSIEQYGNVANSLADVTMKKNSSKAATGLAAGALFPVRQIQDIVSMFPHKDLMFIKTFEGLTCIEISSGNVKWNVSDLKGEIAYIHYDEGSNSILTFGGNPIWMPAFLNRIQVNKKLFRIDATNGEVLWNTNYNRNFLVKNDGGLQNELEKKPDIRIADGKIILNFLQIEVIDFETGASIFETSTGNDAMMNIVPEANPATLFSFPYVKDGILYRAVINRVLAFNQSLVIEAYKLENGELMWVSDELTRRSINNISQIGDYVVVGVDGADGIIFLDKETGKQNSSISLSKSGVTKKWLIDNGVIIAPEKNTIHFITLENTEIKQSINISSIIGNIHKLIIHENNLFVLGSKKGVAKYTLEKGNLVSSIKTGFQPTFFTNTEKILLAPQNPSDAILILSNTDLSVKGSLKKSKKRTTIGWNENFNELYEIKNDKIEKFSIQKN